MEQDPAYSTASSSSGRRTVLAMISFGILMVGALWLYWELYTRPFRPLQNAIAAAFPGSRPSVIGGRHKSHHVENPFILRIVLQMPLTDFDPARNAEQSEQRAIDLVRLAQQYLSLAEYEQLEIHLVQRPQEQSQRLWSVTHSILEWNALLSREPAAAGVDSDSPPPRKPVGETKVK